MASPEATAGINNETDKIEPVEITCKTYWSKAQEFSIIRMSERVGFNEYDLVDWYEIRAKRIAATYARFYLETEDGGDPSKLGRYYWMALGAFASKTVGCILGSVSVILNDIHGRFSSEEVADGLGKGNLWLFMDISAPHWFYNHYPENFFNGMACVNSRDAKNLEPPIQTVVDSMPWSEKSLPIINNMAISGSLKKGFEYVVEIEIATDDQVKRDLQLKHLLEIANHEQGVILQPLIYEHPEFAKWSRWQRELKSRSMEAKAYAEERLSNPWNALTLRRDLYLYIGSSLLTMTIPSFELVFSHACEIDDGEFKSIAPDDMQVENFRSRMDWIEKAAKQFHRLMGEKPEYMHSELQHMAGWVNARDKWLPTRDINE
ncbi:DUF2515 family protein [Sessilibacter corallicola]|uniref:DUF2515 family protein n=1 Tax=Sessilibacter corallicola TaxID=2904075 RepID=UPI001E60F1AD|nr:hypothetical protein [Sessilibacter corallicola]MCE2026839.1 hypothetical protein [Sessilibacter corallicola]